MRADGIAAGGTVSGPRRSFLRRLFATASAPVEAPPAPPVVERGEASTSGVVWSPSALGGAPSAPAELVIGAYRALGRWPLPEDFLDVAAVQQGVRPDPSSFDRPGGFTESVEHLLHFEPGSFSNIVARRFPLEDVLEDGVIPFAECLGGDVLCFDFRADRDAPVVAFWSTDSGLVPLAESFTAFLALLHD